MTIYLKLGKVKRKQGNTTKNLYLQSHYRKYKVTWNPNKHYVRFKGWKRGSSWTGYSSKTLTLDNWKIYYEEMKSFPFVTLKYKTFDEAVRSLNHAKVERNI